MRATYRIQVLLYALELELILAEQGVAVYPHRFDWDEEPTGVRARWGERTALELEAAKVHLRVPGRVKAIRTQGKLVFADLHDGREKLQLSSRELSSAPGRGEAQEEPIEVGNGMFDQDRP